MGGHGVTGSADPLQVGGFLRPPSERADPLEQEEASATDALVIAEEVTKLPMSSSEQASPRQPPTVSDTTAADGCRLSKFYNINSPKLVRCIFTVKMLYIG